MPEFDPAASVFKSRPQNLATLLAAREEQGRLWRADELAAIFRHQLAAPVVVDLGALDAGAALRLKLVCESQGLLLKSFAELFHHPAPPLELLRLTKDFAKLNMDHPESCLPPEIAALLYYTAIATALARLDTRISQLPDADLGRGLLWAKSQAWIDQPTRDLLDEGLRKLPGATGRDGGGIMNQGTPQNPPAGFNPPVSSFAGPIAELIGHGMLAPPSRPGLLAMLDHYEVLRVLGAGGMGIVLLARDPKGGSEVAIKMVKPELAVNQEVARRFVKEAGHMQRLRHPQVMPVMEVSDRAAGPYFVMPYFEQGSLARLIQPGRPLDPGLALEIALQISDGLLFAHRRGIIHRDLKPANVMWSATGKACLADFGLARTLFNDTIIEVDSQQAEGTAPYMSPGVAAGNAEDTRCDIYAFGALLYEMLTGEPPYQGRTSKEIRGKILAGPPATIASRNPQAERRLTLVAEGAMGRELRDRYADMADVLADLQRIKTGKDPIGPHGLVRSWRDRTRRAGGWRVAWILTCLAVLGVVGWALWLKEPVKTAKPASPPPNVATNPLPEVMTNAGSPRILTNSLTETVDTNVVESVPTTTNGLSVNPSPATFSVVGASNQPLYYQWNFGTNAIPGVTTNANAPVTKFLNPVSVAVDGAGNIYAADGEDSTIRKVTPDGRMVILAGQSGSRGITNGPGDQARFILPRGMAIDGAGNVYLADAFTIRKITPAGEASTLAGKTGYSGANDGTGTEAQFNLPSGVAVDAAGNVYVADRYTIRKINPTGVVTTLAGADGHSGSQDGTGAEARFSDKEKGLAVDGAGNIYVADALNNLIRMITPAGVVTTLAGAREAGSRDGSGVKARFFRPHGIAIDSQGNVIIADTSNHVIRRITPLGTVTVLAGRPGISGRSNGPAANALFDQPRGVAVDRAGNIYVVETGNRDIRRITPGGLVSTVAGAVAP